MLSMIISYTKNTPKIISDYFWLTVYFVIFFFLLVCVFYTMNTHYYHYKFFKDFS